MSTALILGATSDMAIAVANKFASKGYNILLASRNSLRLTALQSDLQIRYNINVSILEFNAIDSDTHSSFFNSLIPKPDVAICVFGHLGNQEVAQSDWNETKLIIDSNYTGAVSILNIIAEYYAKQSQGTIVGIASVAGERGRQSNYIYGSAKAGFIAYLSGLRNRLFQNKVHVVTIQPGFVYTKMTENLKLPKMLTATPYDVGEAVYTSVLKRKNIVYVKWFWKWIMLVIKLVPESIFKKLKL